MFFIGSQGSGGFGPRRLDEIDRAAVTAFRAYLAKLKHSDGSPYSKKTLNNILAVLSKPLKYAEEVAMIKAAPKVGMFKVERPEIVWCEFDAYRRILDSAREEGEAWYVAACLAGEAGLRIGEVRALDWQRDVDLIGSVITINHQIRHGKLGPPKGGTRRAVPMNSRLVAALRSLSVLRRGRVVRHGDGSEMTDSDTNSTRSSASPGAPVYLYGAGM